MGQTLLLALAISLTRAAKVPDCPAGSTRLAAEVDRTTSQDAGAGLVDDDLDTPWVSDATKRDDDSQSFILDLGSVHNVSSTVTTWSADRAFQPKTFVLQGRSTQLGEWETLHRMTNATVSCVDRELKNHAEDFALECRSELDAGMQARYLRLRVTEARRANDRQPYMLFDIGVCGPIPGPVECANNVALAATTYSSAQDAGAGATDGNLQMPWTSEPAEDDSNDQWVALDLGTVHDVEAVVALWPIDPMSQPRRYFVQSLDEDTARWSTVASVQMRSRDGSLPSDFGYGTNCSEVTRGAASFFECATHVFGPQRMQHVRLYAASTHDLTVGAYVLFEIEPTRSSNPTNDGSTTVDQTRFGTPWQSEALQDSTENAWLQVDLGGPRSLFTFTVDFYFNRDTQPEYFKLQTSLDETTWLTHSRVSPMLCEPINEAYQSCLVERVTFAFALEATLDALEMERVYGTLEDVAIPHGSSLSDVHASASASQQYSGAVDIVGFIRVDLASRRRLQDSASAATEIQVALNELLQLCLNNPEEMTVEVDEDPDQISVKEKNNNVVIAAVVLGISLVILGLVCIPFVRKRRQAKQRDFLSGMARIGVTAGTQATWTRASFDNGPDLEIDADEVEVQELASPPVLSQAGSQALARARRAKSLTPSAFVAKPMGEVTLTGPSPQLYEAPEDGTSPSRVDERLDRARRAKKEPEQGGQEDGMRI